MITPEIKYPMYHKMSFQEVDKIRQQIIAGNENMLINDLELFLYLNQMDPKYARRIKLIQNLSIISFVTTIVFLLINWKISIVLFIAALVFDSSSRKFAKKYIYKQCTEDRVFLKFSLSTGLVKRQIDEILEKLKGIQIESSEDIQKSLNVNEVEALRILGKLSTEGYLKVIKKKN